MINILYLLRFISKILKYRLYKKNIFSLPLTLLSFILFPLTFFKIKNLSKGSRLCLFLRDMGPIYIKFGQILSLCHDIIGYEIAESLSELRDRLPPFSNELAIQSIEKNLKKKISEVFIEFDYKVIAAASISQVYKAKKLDGKEVAVKILRPKIHEDYEKNIKFLYFIASFLELFEKFKRLRVKNVIEIFDNAMKIELDLRMEASAAEEIRNDLIEDTNIYIPIVDWELTTNDLLVLEWVHGINVSDVKKLKEYNINLRTLASNLAISFFNQAYKNGYFHADMHPGNILVREDGVLVFIDFGIMGRLKEKDRIAIAEILNGFLNQDYLRVAEVHLDVGYIDKDIDVQIFAQSLRSIGASIVNKQLKDISVANLLAQIFKVTKDFNMKTQPQLVMLQKTTFMVESIGRMLDPNINIWKLAEPWISDWAKKNISLEAKIYKAIKLKLKGIISKAINQL
jgi:ubiquinone biosynthesis protein